MSIRTDFRRALQKALSAQIKDRTGADLEFTGGIVEGPQPDRDIGCVWWEGKRPFSRDGNEEENFYRVRVFRLFRQDQGAETPRVEQAEELERLAEELEAALKAVLARPQLESVSGETLVNGHDFFSVLEVTTNYPSQFVEASLTAYARNRSARGG